jgi:UDP-N-acetylglucosamine 4,6-dehydratase
MAKTTSSLQTRPDLGFLKGKVVLVTGGTGSFGKKFVDTLLKHSGVKKLIVFSRDELKQSEMQAVFSDPRMRYFIGDVRDLQRLQRAFHGVDFVVHAAALKQVPALEYNPFEAVLTNIMGAENIINAAIDQGVQKVVALSTDKACNPVNLYGATKLCAEKLFTAGNAYATGMKARFSCVRYGNVVGSRGSVIPLYREKRKTGVLPVTDERMTRFWITLDEGVNMVLSALDVMRGGETFVPKIASMRVMDLAKAIAPECKIKLVGIRPGEKLHELMCPKDDSHLTLEFEDHYVLRPAIRFVGVENDYALNALGESGTPVAEGFEYSSETNPRFLSMAELVELDRAP